MKKFSLLLLVLSLMNVCVYGQHYVVTRNTFDQVNIHFTTGTTNVQNVKIASTTYSHLEMEDYGLSMKVGCPQLPIMTKLLEIPLCDSVIANITDAEYEEYDAAQLGIAHEIFPAQPSYPKSYTGERVFTRNNEVYNTNAFYSEPLVHVEKAGIMRDVALANLAISPVAYNPVTHKIRIYTHIDVSISYVNANEPATYELKAKYGSPLFNVGYESVINPSMGSRNEINASHIKYLIIAHAMFADNENLNEFVQWKKRLGYQVVVAYTNDPAVGSTTTSIKNYILTHYNNATAENPAPSFILFVGDVQQIPAFSSTEQNSHVTDLNYACWTSGDNIPDCYYGRFSATNASQLAPQISKTLMYEQYTMPDPSYLGKAVLIAGTDASFSPEFANGQVNYIYNNYINTTSTTHNYNTVYKHNYNCSSQASTIRSEIGDGVGWANYTAHGSEDGWYDPSFTISHISSMHNEGKYGIMIGNCCLTGKFNQSECFGEALLRANGKGAMAYIGGSEVTYWYEDYYWAVGLRNSVVANPNYDSQHLGAYDRIFHTHNEASSNWSTTLGGLLMGGNLAVQSSQSNYKKYYWEIYHIFGDPSIRPYLGTPSNMNVSANDVIMIGSDSYQVQTEPLAYVALTHNNELVAATFADETGTADLSLPDIEPGEYELAIGAQNHIQYFKTIHVIVPEGPYVLASNIALAGNSTPTAGNTISLDLTLENIGVQNASNVTATILCNTPGISIYQGSANQATLNIGQSAALNNAFIASLSPDIEDGTVAEFVITVNWGANSSSKVFRLVINAPKLVMDDYSIQPVGGSTFIAPGDNVTVSFVNKNIGHACLYDATVDLTCNYSPVVVTSSSFNIYSIEANNTCSNTFNVQVSNTVPDLTVIPLYYHIIYGNVHHIDTIFLTVGQAMEDFESGDFSVFNWQNSGTNAWTITSSQPYAGNYCARSKANLSNNGTSTMQITMNAASDGNISFFRKVSSENGYDFFKFYIDGQEQESQSGNVNWSQASFPVAAGNHTYKFSYSKDYSSTGGSDCAWVDNVIFPGMGTMAVNDIEDPVGITENTIDNLQIYPNPCSDALHISSSKNMRQVQLFDLSGRMISNTAVAEQETLLNVSHLSSGVYFIKIISNDNTTSTSKFIKK